MKKNQQRRGNGITVDKKRCLYEDHRGILRCSYLENEAKKLRGKNRIEKLYYEALKADEDYSAACEPYSGRWRADHRIASVQSAYQTKVHADKKLQYAMEYFRSHE